MGWQVILMEEVHTWFLDMTRSDPLSADRVAAAIDMLSEQGPGMGRPLVDRIQTSSFHNMKELRPGSAGRSEIRILFIFDPVQRAILLVSGDKSGSWREWYRDAIKIADERYRDWLAGQRNREV